MFFSDSESQIFDNKLLVCEMLKRKEAVVFKADNFEDKLSNDYELVVSSGAVSCDKIPLVDYYGKNDGVNLVKSVECEEKIQRKIIAKILKPQYNENIINKK